MRELNLNKNTREEIRDAIKQFEKIIPTRYDREYHKLFGCSFSRYHLGSCRSGVDGADSYDIYQCSVCKKYFYVFHGCPAIL